MIEGLWTFEALNSAPARGDVKTVKSFNINMLT